MRINIVNPLTSDGNIRRIIECYFKSRTREQFSANIKNYVSFRNYSEKNSEDFASCEFGKLLFEYWKNQISNSNIEKFPYKKYNINETDLLYLKSYIKNQEKISVEGYGISNTQNTRLYEIFNKFNYIDEKNDYRTINSYMYYIDQKFELDNEFIVSINIKSKTLIFKLLTKYIGVCLSKKLPFYIKFSDTLNNDNTIMVYANKNNLEKIINIFTDIRNSNPELDAELKDVVKRPQILCGMVDDWIGVRQIDDQFFDNRINCLYDSIHLTVSKWYDEDFKTKESQYMDMTYKDVIDYEIRTYFNHELNYLCLNTIKEIFIKNKIDKVLEEIINTKYEDLKEYRVHVGKGVDIKISREDINNKIYDLLGNIYRNNKEFLDEVRNNIVVCCKKYNIDSKRFYLDTKSSDILYAIYDETSLLDLEDYIPSKEKVLNRNYK